MFEKRIIKQPDMDRCKGCDVTYCLIEQDNFSSPSDVEKACEAVKKAYAFGKIDSTVSRIAKDNPEMPIYIDQESA